jgi:hypothetical protein
MKWNLCCFAGSRLCEVKLPFTRIQKPHFFFQVFTFGWVLLTLGIKGQTMNTHYQILGRAGGGVLGVMKRYAMPCAWDVAWLRCKVWLKSW